MVGSAVRVVPRDEDHRRLTSALSEGRRTTWAVHQDGLRAWSSRSLSYGGMEAAGRDGVPPLYGQVVAVRAGRGEARASEGVDVPSLFFLILYIHTNTYVHTEAGCERESAGYGVLASMPGTVPTPRNNGAGMTHHKQE